MDQLLLHHHIVLTVGEIVVRIVQIIQINTILLNEVFVRKDLLVIKKYDFALIGIKEFCILGGLRQIVYSHYKSVVPLHDSAQK